MRLTVGVNNISTVLVDPPRAGLDAGTCALISQFQKIIYISCNPETLARDVDMLRSTHTVQNVAAFDQFPYTHHLEGGVFLVRKPVTDANVPSTDVSTIVNEEEIVQQAEKKQRIE